jgi:hypothetical protein
MTIMNKDLSKVLSMPQSTLSKQLITLGGSVLIAIGVSACGDDGVDSTPDDIQLHADAGDAGGADGGLHPASSGSSRPVSSGSSRPGSSGSTPSPGGTQPAGTSTTQGQTDLDGGVPPVVTDGGVIVEGPDGSVGPTPPEGDSSVYPAPPEGDGGTDPGTPDSGGPIVEPPLEACEVATEQECFDNCLPVVEEHFLNKCTDGCFPFDNAARLPLYVNGELPPL